MCRRAGWSRAAGFVLVLVLVWVAALGACRLFPSDQGTIRARALEGRLRGHACTSPGDEAKLRPKVLLIGIDGLRSDALEVSETPALHGLMAEGAFSLRAQSGDAARSGPNWSSVLTGVWRDRHRVDSNQFFWHHLEDFPDIFARLREQVPGVQTAFVYSWNKLHVFGTQAAIRVFDDFEDCGDACAVLAARTLIDRADADFLFLYLRGVDEAGHEFGFSPSVPEYRAQLAAADRAIGSLLGRVRARCSFAHERWLVLVTTDHGGGGPGEGPKQHGANTPPDRDVLFVAAELGPSPRGAYDSLPRGELFPPPRQVDVVPTVLEHFGVLPHGDGRMDGLPLGELVRLGRAATSTGANLIVNGGFELDRGLGSSAVDVSPLGWREYGCAVARTRASVELPTEARGGNILWAEGESPCIAEQIVRTASISARGGRFVLSAVLGGQRQTPEVTLAFDVRRGEEAARAAPGRDAAVWAPASITLGPFPGDGRLACWRATGPVPGGATGARVTLRFPGREPSFADDVALRFAPEAPSGVSPTRCAPQEAPP